VPLGFLLEGPALRRSCSGDHMTDCRDPSII
jgi:hypothetical protein